MTKKQLIEYMETSIVSLESIYRRALELGLEDTQEFLNWLDKLNEISVRK